MFTKGGLDLRGHEPGIAGPLQEMSQTLVQPSGAGGGCAKLGADAGSDGQKVRVMKPVGQDGFDYTYVLMPMRF